MARSDDSLSTADVARRLGVSTPTVQRWVDLGYLKAWKTVGGHRRIDADSVQRFIDQNGLEGVTPADAAVAPAAADHPLVLVVDDNPDDRDVLTAMVEAALPGARITLATNGFEALLAIGRLRPQVVISDLLMPHMNGLEMLRHLGSEPDADARPRVIVAVSSETPRRLAHLGALPRGVHFLQKPVDPAAMARLLQQGLAETAARSAASRTAR